MAPSLPCGEEDMQSVKRQKINDRREATRNGFRVFSFSSRYNEIDENDDDDNRPLLVRHVNLKAKRKQKQAEKINMGMELPQAGSKGLFFWEDSDDDKPLATQLLGKPKISDDSDDDDDNLLLCTKIKPSTRLPEKKADLISKKRPGSMGIRSENPGFERLKDSSVNGTTPLNMEAGEANLGKPCSSSSQDTDLGLKAMNVYDDSDDGKSLATLLRGKPKASSDSGDDDDDDNLLLCAKIKSSTKLSEKKVAVIAKKRPRLRDDSDDDKILSVQPVGKPKASSDLDDSDDDDLLLCSKIKPSTKLSKKKVNVSTNKRPGLKDVSDESDDDRPLATQLLGRQKASSDLDEDDDNLPLFIKSKLLTKLSKKKRTGLKDEDNDDDMPLAKRIPALAKIKKSIAMKNLSAISAATVAARKVIEARKAKMKSNKSLKKSKKSLKKSNKFLKKKGDGKSDSKAPGAGGGQKWTTLEHSGVIFPPPYKPHRVKMLYQGTPVALTPEQEECATLFAVMCDTDYATKQMFLQNFWADWKKKLGPAHVIKNLEGCDFAPIYEWHLAEREKKKQMTAEEKKILKEEKMKQEEKYMWALVDGVKEKVGNFRVEPPGLFRGRGEHPKMGKFKRRILPEDIVINIGEGAQIPDCPMPGHKWKEIRHDNTVTWLALWNDPINSKECKYVFLAPSSNLKGQSDKEKYEKARTLKDYIQRIRENYRNKFTAKDSTARQIAVATYLIDFLALRAGNEKDDDEADTVGCCSLKVEHVTLVPPRGLQFDFLGKDSVRYYKLVDVDGLVYKAIGDFKAGKENGEDIFDKLDTNKLNAHLKELMPGLTAKVFRTYNASFTLDNELKTLEGSNVPEKLAFYNQANKTVAILCNHQRSVSKTHDTQMEKLDGKLQELENFLEELKIDLQRAEKGKPPLKDADGKPKKNQTSEVLEKKISQMNKKIQNIRLAKKLKDDLKTVALGTSKINYMDPRITVAWCKRNEVPIEKIFNKSLLAKFAWAMDVDMDYYF